SPPRSPSPAPAAPPACTAARSPSPGPAPTSPPLRTVSPGVPSPPSPPPAAPPGPGAPGRRPASQRPPQRRGGPQGSSRRASAPPPRSWRAAGRRRSVDPQPSARPARGGSELPGWGPLVSLRGYVAELTSVEAVVQDQELRVLADVVRSEVPERREELGRQVLRPLPRSTPVTHQLRELLEVALELGELDVLRPLRVRQPLLLLHVQHELVGDAVALLQLPRRILLRNLRPLRLHQGVRLRDAGHLVPRQTGLIQSPVHVVLVRPPLLPGEPQLGVPGHMRRRPHHIALLGDRRHERLHEIGRAHV